ncbi:uncharacterized protein LOC113329638 [Papaver somniferum]|uniref:uncharacterized protein LOC113329638 n=1 Tax=Papaver somniferum TaxID=3469 RepID=UPI000E704E75|nr:uncharacterized protein LOC113329638 [Papaver somniferum]
MASPSVHVGEQIQISTVTYDNYDEQVIGFGYNRSNNEYKVVGIVFGYGSGMIVVHTLQGDTRWRNRSCMFEKQLLSGFEVFRGSSVSAGIFANGFLHWIDQINKSIIIAFDLEDDKFKFLLSIPGGRGAKYVDLMVLGGNLCVLEVVPSKHVTVWESGYSKEQHGFVYPNWVTKFKIALQDYSWFEPFALTKSDDKCLLWYNVVLSCYDPDTKTLRKLDETLKKLMDDSTPSVYTTTRATHHVNIIASLKVIMEERVGMKRKAHEDRDRKRKTYWYD